MDIRKIRDSYPGLTNAKLGELLFPDHKHPEKALGRLMAGKAGMTEEQIKKLAVFLAVKPGELFEDSLVFSWLDKTEKSGLLTLQKGIYTAVYNPKTGVTTLSRQGNALMEKVLVSDATLLSDYVKKLDEAIIECETEDLG